MQMKMKKRVNTGNFYRECEIFFAKKFDFGARNGSTNGAVEGPYTLLCSLSVFCKFLSPQYV